MQGIIAPLTIANSHHLMEMLPVEVQRKLLMGVLAGMVNLQEKQVLEMFPRSAIAFNFGAWIHFLLLAVTLREEDDK